MDQTPQQTCSIDGCAKPIRSRGWCATHWSRWSRHGDPLAGGPVRDVGIEGCSIDGCELPHYGHGWCRLHWNRWKRNGDPLAERMAADGAPLAYLTEHLNDDTDECIVWPYSKKTSGHGQIVIDGRNERVHVLACIHAHGPRPPGLYALHGPCHNPACFNPRHLSWGTPAENMADKRRDDTWQAGERSPAARLTQAQVNEIRARYAAGGIFQRTLAAEYGVSGPQISRIINGQSRVSGG